ncbi:hypothetical protein niasHT_015476 [Heterodera trifolii]|uniref:Uncharacterized protein n=1 Tax=Heterodera trifolii TaxID=157864 RepID=A0ABD2L065_9BILA
MEKEGGIKGWSGDERRTDSPSSSASPPMDVIASIVRRPTAQSFSSSDECEVKRTDRTDDAFLGAIVNGYIGGKEEEEEEVSGGSGGSIHPLPTALSSSSSFTAFVGRWSRDDDDDDEEQEEDEVEEEGKEEEEEKENEEETN